MDHIKAMMQTTIPAAVVSVIIYLGIGIFISGDSYDASTVDSIMNGLKGMFHINLIPVIPIVIVIVMILMKKGTIVSMMSGTVVAILIAVIYQGYSVADMGTFLYSGFTCNPYQSVEPWRYDKYVKSVGSICRWTWTWRNPG